MLINRFLGHFAGKSFDVIILYSIKLLLLLFRFACTVCGYIMHNTKQTKWKKKEQMKTISTVNVKEIRYAFLYNSTSSSDEIYCFLCCANMRVFVLPNIFFSRALEILPRLASFSKKSVNFCRDSWASDPPEITKHCGCSIYGSG